MSFSFQTLLYTWGSFLYTNLKITLPSMGGVSYLLMSNCGLPFEDQPFLSHPINLLMEVEIIKLTEDDDALAS